MADVLVVGVAVVDFMLAVDAFPAAASKYRARDGAVVGGGCAANAAVAIARLGGRARLAARLGDNPIGDLIAADLAEEGVDISLLHRTTGARSSFSSVLVDPAGERQIVNFRGEGLTDDPGWIGKCPPVQAVLADTRWSAGAVRALDLARNWGVPGVVDAEAPMDAAVLGAASHVAFSRQGLFSFTGGDELVPALLGAGARLPGWVAVTDGAHGTFYLDRRCAPDGGKVAHVPAFEVEVKDTLGAGDIWHGAFTLALAEGQSEAAAVRFASAAAALKCTTFGGRKGCPDRETVAQFLKENA